jgi:hypothetical protein
VTQQSQQPDAAQSTIQLRDFGGVNVTDTRTSIEDTEFAWLENAIPVGKGNMRLVPGSGTILATVAAGITSMWGVVLRTGTNTSSLLLTINNNGSMNQVDASSGTNEGLFPVHRDDDAPHDLVDDGRDGYRGLQRAGLVHCGQWRPAHPDTAILSPR